MHGCAWPVAALLLWPLAGFAANGPARLLGDLNQATEFVDATPTDPVVRGGLAYFTAFDGAGRGLWRSDGTPAGTLRLALLDPEIEQVEVGPWLDGEVYLALQTNFPPTRRLWRSDGTPQGTGTVDGPPFDPDAVTAWEGASYYFDRPAQPGPTDLTTLWRSDGGTLRELGGEGGHAPETPVVVGGWLLMTMWDRARGKELWRSDGTGEGTRRLRDLNPGPEDSRPRALTRLGERACFMATTGRSPDSRERLWCSDGTAAGTAPVTDQHLGFVRTLRAAIGLLWIESDVNHVATLWRSDGTPGGTFSAGRGGAAIRRVRGEIVLPQKALGAQRGVVAHGWHAGRHDAPACLAHVAYRLRL